MKKERFLHTGKSPHWQGYQPGQRGSFKASEESTATGLQRAKWREACVDGQCHPALPSLRLSSTRVDSGCMLRLGLCRSDMGERTEVCCVETV